MNKNHLKSFENDIKSVFTDRFISLVVYGSYLSKNFNNKNSKINTMLVVKNYTTGDLLKLNQLMRKKFRKNFIIPLIFSEQEFQTSRDVFPIEFLDIKENYKILAGTDIIENLNISFDNLRLQCETELRGKYIYIREIFIESATNKKALYKLFKTSLKSFTLLLKNIYRLENKPVPSDREEIWKQAESILNIDYNLIARIMHLKSGMKLKVFQDLFKSYFIELNKIINFVDKWHA